MSNIHPTAIVDPKANIGPNVSIGPYSIVGPDVTLDENVEIKAHVVIDGRTSIGVGTTIYPFASIGSPPQDLKYKGELSQLIIGKNCIIREHVTMNPGTESGGMKTVVGDNCLLMVGVHVAHDCILGNHVIMANNATLGGHVVVGDHVLIGGLAGVHQFVRIGSYAVVAGTAGVNADVIPFGRVKGERAYLAGLNLVGMERGGFSKEQIKTLQKVFVDLFGDKGTMEERLSQMEQDFANDPSVMQILRFAREKERFGLCRPEDRAVA